MSVLKQSSYVPEFEGMRGLMAWWVVLGHVANRIGIHFSSDLSAPWKLIVLTNIPVDIFIALSGFAIFTLLSKDRSDYFRYMLGRFFRIYPVYVFCLVVGILLFDWRYAQLLVDPLVSSAHLQATTMLAQSIHDYYPQHIIAHLLLMHGVIPDQVIYGSGQAFVGPAWSLSLEWQFYLLAPLLFVLMNRQKYIAVLIGVLFIGLDLASRFYGLSFSYGAFLPLKIGFFFAGMATFFYRNDNRSLAALLLLIAFVQVLLSNNTKAGLISLLLWVLLSIVILNHSGAGSSLARGVRQALSSNVLKFIGKLSFSIYLIHVFVIDFLASYLLQYSISDLSQVQLYLLLLIPTVLLTLLVSILIHYSIEAPFIRLGKIFRK